MYILVPLILLGFDVPLEDDGTFESLFGFVSPLFCSEIVLPNGFTFCAKAFIMLPAGRYFATTYVLPDFDLAKPAPICLLPIQTTFKI